MKKIFLITVATILFATLVFVVVKSNFLPSKSFSPQDREAALSNQSLPIAATMVAPKGEIFVRIADDANERQLGLSYFKSLPADQGMLFLFDDLGIHPFWMRGMNFPIDIIWLKRVSPDSFEVVYVAENVDPSTYPQTMAPEAEADAVLEVGAGKAKDFGIVVGVFLKK